LAFLIFNVQSVVVSVVCSRKKDTHHLRSRFCTANVRKRRADEEWQRRRECPKPICKVKCQSTAIKAL